MNAAAVATVAWRVAGETRVTVVVKAAFALVPEAPMRAIPPLPCLTRDVHHQDDPARSVRVALETAPYLAQAEVLLMGHGYAPPGRPLPSLGVRLGVLRDGRPLLDKSLLLQGERAPGRADFRPFQHLPLVYELAAGSADRNPVGVDVARGRVPSVLSAAAGISPGFGPIARSWPARRALLGGAPADKLEGVRLEIPAAFDWAYFQASPRDQRIDFLRGDEWILLGGMHPTLPLLRSQLPRVSAKARVYGRRAGPLDVSLVADTLAIDTDAQTATVLFRGSFVATEAELASLEVLTGVSVQGAPIALPDRLAPTVLDEDDDDALRGTVALPDHHALIEPDDDDDDPLRGTVALPDHHALIEPDDDDDPLRGTVAIGRVEPRGPALPFAGGAARIPPPAARPAAPRPLDEERTRTLSFVRPDTVAPHQGLPFAPASSPEVLPFGGAPSDEVTPAAPAPSVAFQPPPVVAPAAPPSVLAPAARVVAPAAPPPVLAPAAPPPVLAPAAPPPVVAPAAPPPVLAPAAPPPPLAARVTVADDDDDDDDPLRRTVGITRAFPPRAATPFAPAASTPPRRPAPAGAPPGSPWASDPEVPAPAPPEGPVETTRLASFAHLLAGGASVDPPGPPDVPSRTSDAIPVFHQGPLTVVTLPWQVRPPRDSITVIAKGSFAIVPDGPAAPLAEPDLPIGDIHVDDDLAKSVVYPSDFAVFKPKADVVLRGHAFAPGGSSPAAEVRFAFGHPSARFTRRLAVFGERLWQRTLLGLAPTAPRPFERVALVHENAFGGPGFDPNPAGTGYKAAAGQGGVARLPQLEDPDHLVKSPNDRPAPACFAPIAMTWPARWSKLGTYDARWLKTRWPYFPEDFDWAHFQSAPPSQQLDDLRGDEPFEVTGVRPDTPRVTGMLPGLRARCFMQKTEEEGGAFEEVRLRLDTAVIDTDAMRIHLVWRGLIEVTDDDAPEIAALFAALEPLAAAPMSLDEARARFLAVVHPREPVEESPEGEPAVANEVEPEPSEADAAIAELEATALARQEAIEREMAEAGIEPPAPRTLVPPDPEAMIATLRANGADEDDLAALLEALHPAVEDAEAAPTPLREQVLAKLAAGEPLDGMELDGADLSDLDLAGQSLIGAELRRANLQGSRLTGADLSDAGLAGADLTGANLDGARLAGADLTGAELGGASLCKADLSDADLTGAKGEGARYDGATCPRAVFTEGVWARARFDGASLAAADFTRSVLDGAVFTGALMPDVLLYDARGEGVRFEEADLTDARADGVVLTKALFRKARAPGSVWEKATLDDASFIGAVLTGASFVRASCPRASFSGADLTEASMSRAKLPKAQLFKANLHMAQLDRADLTGADLRGANLHAAETWRAKLGGADLDFAIVTGTKLRGLA